MFAGRGRLAAMFEAEPGTYVLTDFLVRSFDRPVVAELGLDRYPELRDDYFGTTGGWCGWPSSPTPELRAAAEEAAAAIGLPLEEVAAGDRLLERDLAALLGGA